MSTKVQPVSRMEDNIETAVTATAFVSSTPPSPKVSMFAKKSGFVIPKNKLSGSLVPIFRGSKKPGATDVESEESTKQALRKTKWGPDLTQDAFVRKGRTLAYQTRLDQITEQLKSRIMETRDDYDSPVAHGAAQESPDHQNAEKSELLELERREVIGEILKLNPSFKAPTDYKPLLKEDKVPIPIKDYLGHNFIGLIFGPAGDTQKRLEKETGAKIRVYGMKSDTKKESEITFSDGNESHGGYEDLYVLVTAETYEKVDAAISLIELLVAPVLANPLGVSKTDTVSGDNPATVSQDTPLSYTISPSQGAAQPFTGPGPAPPLPRFQPFPNQWVPTSQSSGFIPPPFPNPLVSSNPLNPTPVPSSFGLRPMGPFGSGPPNPALGPSQPQLILHRPHMMPNYSAPPRNPSLPPLQIAPGQPCFSGPPPFTLNPTRPNQNVRPVGPPVPRSGPPYTFPDRPVTSSGWSQPPAGSPGAMRPNMPQILQPMNRPQAPRSPFRPSAAPSPGKSLPPVGPTTSTAIPPPSINPQPITALRPQQPSSNNFTFQTHRPQTPNQPGLQFMPPQNPPVQQPPQSPSFRPGMFIRPQNTHQMGQSTMAAPPARQPLYPGPGPQPPVTHGPPMGPRQFNAPAGPFPPRPANLGQPPQNHPSMGFRPQNFLGPPNQQFRGNVPYSSGRPGLNPSGPQQIYDPFSPSAAPPRPGNPQNSRKQESDPEYDDLMASVGVK